MDKVEMVQVHLYYEDIKHVGQADVQDGDIQAATDRALVLAMDQKAGYRGK